jgi:hypothetical protein
MTHDELLEELNYAIQEYDKAYDNTNYYYTALRAVVELHKPESSRMPFCVECRGVWQGEIDVVLYPCPTIKAIEKELA